jgi:hypothetical protein
VSVQLVGSSERGIRVGMQSPDVGEHSSTPCTLIVSIGVPSASRTALTDFSPDCCAANAAQSKNPCASRARATTRSCSA